MLTGIARAYNTRHSSLITVGDKVMPICKEAEIDATKYVDSVSKMMVKVDHTKWAGTIVEDKPLPPTAFDASVEGKRTAILSAVEDYVTKHFGGGANDDNEERSDELNNTILSRFAPRFCSSFHYH